MRFICHRLGHLERIDFTKGAFWTQVCFWLCEGSNNCHFVAWKSWSLLAGCKSCGFAACLILTFPWGAAGGGQSSFSPSLKESLSEANKKTFHERDTGMKPALQFNQHGSLEVGKRLRVKYFRLCALNLTLINSLRFTSVVLSQASLLHQTPPAPSALFISVASQQGFG